MQDLMDGMIVRDQSGFFVVETPDGQRITCRLRGRLMEEARATDIAAIGDRVRFSLNADGSGAIESIAERTSVISRAVRTEGPRGSGASEREQVIIANADQALFVFAAAQPAPSPRLVDRFVVIGEKAGISLALVLNKIDLDTDGSSRALFETYARLGYPVLQTSAREGIGLTALADYLRGKVSVFTGPSGVGKTSLLNQVQPGLGRAVKAVSNYHLEGQHTTRDSELIRLADGGYLADTPGMRTLTVWDIEPEELDGYFPEIAARVPECRFANCTHRTEPGCAVRTAAHVGQIAASRYESYVVLRQELEAAYAL